MSQAGTVDVEQANPNIPTRFDADTGDAIPIANVLDIVGSTVANATNAKPLSTSGAGNTITIEVQVGTAITGAPADKNDAGLASFDDTAFAVDANGYVTLIGGGGATTNIDVDASTAPGTDPVVPSMGNIIMTGGQVATGVVGANVIRTNSLAANTVTIEIQRSTAVAGSDSTKNGVAHFDSSAFSVDANGFVTLAGGAGPAVDSFTTDVAGPVVPSATGVIDVTGTSVFSNGTVANTITLNVQATANTFLVGAGAGTTATELGPLTNGQLIIGQTAGAPLAGSITSTNGSVTITPGAGTIDLSVAASDDAILTLTGDAGGAVSPTAGDIDFQGVTVANAANAKPVFVQGTPGTSLIEVDVQVATERTGAPANMNDAGICSFDDTEFTVDVNGFVQLAGTGAGQTITGDSGGALSPTAGNWNILGLGETSTSGSGSTLSILSPRVTTWIVDPTANVGTHQTITAALAASSSGDTIFVRPGTYVENITLPAGITIVGTPSTEEIGQTILNGKITQTATGTSSVSHLRITTNSDVCVDIGGSGLIQTSFNDCVFSFSDADCLTVNNASGSPAFNDCIFRQTGASLDLFNLTSCGQVTYTRCDLSNSGVTPGVSNIASGLVVFRYSGLGEHRFTSSGAANIQARYSQFFTFNNNVTPITTAGTGVNHEFEMCYFRTGTAVAIVCGSGTTITLDSISINSQNGAPVTATGTVLYTSKNYTGGITFDGGTNTLSTYEEGTWTPTVIGGTVAGTATYTTQVGWYQRVGNTVHYAYRLNYNSGTGSGSLRVEGLPFTSSATVYNNIGCCYGDSALTIAAGIDQVLIEVIANSTQIIYDSWDFNTSLAPLSYDAVCITSGSGSYRI